MPAGMASRGENINHFNGVRLRVLGSGELQLKMLSLPNNNNVQREVIMPSVDMDTLNQQREPLKKVNFTSQRAQLEIKTTRINEVFKINRLVIFAKPVFTNFPG